jgi:hypothetical protein
MISAAVIGILMMLSAIIVDAQPEPSYKLIGIEWKSGGHLIGWVFWFGLLIALFGGGSSGYQRRTNHVTINKYGNGRYDYNKRHSGDLV